jgi:hypothetical protein
MAEGSSGRSGLRPQVLSTWKRRGQSPSGYCGSTMGGAAAARRGCRAGSGTAGSGAAESEGGGPGGWGVW